MEIEAELASFLNSFCAMCRKDRGGKLCSCAFPCSLTFKSQMLVKIHELLGLEKPPDRRAIQVMSKKKKLDLEFSVKNLVKMKGVLFYLA